MKRFNSPLSLCLALLFVVSMTPRQIEAQLAPTGGHYAGRATDTGDEPGIVNASGGYAASVPLDLPAARGGLPLPLQIVSGARGVGAAGLGWDVPLSYIRRDTSFARRRPAARDDTPGVSSPPKGREQVSLTLQGRQLDLVRKGQAWVARHDAPELLLREQTGAWVLFDGNGRTYVFTTPSALSGAGLWLLSSVSGPGGTKVQLDYEIATPALPGGSGVSIDLVLISYNTHPQTGCAKHEVTLRYGAAAASPLSLSMLGDRVLARMRTLAAVDVKSRPSCAAATERLRRYELSYLADADTQLPRLSSVRMFGRQGTAEENIAVPIASYVYGSATRYDTPTNTRKLRYEKTQTIAMPVEADGAKVSSTVLDGAVVVPGLGGVGYTTWQSLTDVTGDGRPDLVFPKNGKLWVARNRPGAGGSTILDAQSVGQLSDGPFETRSSSNTRFGYDIQSSNVDQVWRQAIDVNGDGRVDLIDAAEEAGRWVIYLNTPDPGPSGVKWVRLTYSIATLYHHLHARGLRVNPDFLPLSSRFTGRGRAVNACWKFDGTKWVSFPGGFQTHQCSGVGGALIPGSVGPEVTYTEWEVKDINGDGYPDVVFNSSPVDLVLIVPDAPGATGNILTAPAVFKPQPVRGDNNVDAVLNTRGVLFASEGNPFSDPVTIKPNTLCGVSLWASTGDRQETICAIADVNGDGVPDRIENRSDVFLGTGLGFSSVKLMLPGTFATQKSPQVQACLPPATGATTYAAYQIAGLRDLTGDGIPDYLELSADQATWRVYIGTGTGFAAPIDIDVPGGGFFLSSETESCDGKASSTSGGLYDIDGDGKAEIVVLSGPGLDVFQLAGGSVPRTPEAGRLVQVDNGFGAKTSIGYRSAKEDGSTLHQVPFPEVVVTSVETAGALGLGGSLSVTRYAYGGAELMFDSALDAFTLPGYRRSVELRVSSMQLGKAEGQAILTDTYPLAPFAATSKSDRFGRYLRAGRLRDLTLLSGSVVNDPWAMLPTDVTTDARRIGGSHYDWATKLFEEPASPDSPSGIDCIEMAYPLDFEASVIADFGPNSYDVCSAHGFMYGIATESWRGDAAPPSTSNVTTRSEVRDIDDLGRQIAVAHLNDLYRSDDDVCVETQYAAPTGQNERVLSAPRSRRLWDCKEPITYATEYFEYDNLPAGSVSSGFVTSHSVERRATDDGTLLNTVRTFDAGYDIAGVPTSVTSKREDGAVRTVTLQYEPFGLVSVGAMIAGTGAPPVQVTVARDPITLNALSTTDVNHTQRGTDFDGFGRVVRSKITPPGGSLGVLSTRSYLGFSGADPLGRRIVSKNFTDPVAPASVGAAIGRTDIVYLDELGRDRRTELALGADYANQTLIAGARSYDSLGRVAFAADPYPSSQDAATAYGTTYLFKTDGSPSCFIRGKGPQLLNAVTDEPTERYPTCFTRSFLDHQETIGVNDAAALLVGSPQAGVTTLATLTAIGRLVSRSTWKAGARLEHALFAHDRLGHLTSMTRYQDAAGGTNPVQWSRRFDSVGQILQLQEPESAPQFNKYSDWGELIETQWTDTTLLPSVDRRLVSTYDALGRVTHREERNNGLPDPDTVNEYLYDLGVSVPPQVTPTYVLGRLAQAKAPTGEVFFSYDVFGRVNARAFTDIQGDTYVEKTTIHADGAASVLEFDLPDTGYKQERVKYSYDSAARLRSMKFSDASGSQDLYEASEIDPLGRVRKARYGGKVDYVASYADLGRRLMNEATISSALGSRRIVYLGFDPLVRERARREITNGALSGPTTSVIYDALGRLSAAVQTDGVTTLSQRQFAYDALGNILGLEDFIGASDAALSYHTIDRDRVCRIGYGNGGLGGTACNVAYDAVGNIIEQATRTGHRTLSYFISGNVRIISDQATQARFRYDPFGNVQELDLQSGNTSDTRHDRRYGGLIERRDEVAGGSTKSFISRQIPGPGGIIASRRGSGKDWVFHFGEQRGNRFFTDANGAFVQDVDYQSYGESKSAGVQPGSAEYTPSQWNGGDALAAFGLAHLGARLYDPVIGRFLSRDPLLSPRTSATTNPYAFALNDPVNLSDPSGLEECTGEDCVGLIPNYFPIGPNGTGPPGGYIPSGFMRPHANPPGSLPAADPDDLPRLSRWAVTLAKVERLLGSRRRVGRGRLRRTHCQRSALLRRRN